jgi:O-antigen/teichoic acid export membrane protein
MLRLTTWLPLFDRADPGWSPGRRLASGTAWSIVGAVSSRGLALVSFIFVARFIGQAPFGALGIVQSTVLMLQVVAGFGLRLTASKFIAATRKSDPIRAGRIAALTIVFAAFSGLVMTAVLLYLAEPLARTVLVDTSLAPLLFVVSPVLIAGALGGAQNGILAGLEAFSAIAWAGLLSGLCAFPLVVGGAWFFGLDGAVWGIVLREFLALVIGQIALRSTMRKHGIPIDYAGFRSERKMLLVFSLPAFLATAASGPAGWLCNIIVVRTPDGFGQIGLFAAANQWRALILFLPLYLAGVVLPILSELRSRDDHLAHAAFLRKAVLAASVPAVAGAIGISLAAPLIMGFYGSGFAEGGFILVLLSGAAAFAAVATVFEQVMLSAGKTWLLCAVNVGGGVVIVASTAAATLFLSGGIAMALGSVLGSFSMLVVGWLVVRSLAPTGGCTGATPPGLEQS